MGAPATNIVHASLLPRRAACHRCLRPQSTCVARWRVRPPIAPRCWCCSTRRNSGRPRTAWRCCACLWRTARWSWASASRPGAEALLQRPGWDTRLLYPDVPAAPAPSAPCDRRRCAPAAGGDRRDVAQEPAHAHRAPGLGRVAAAVADAPAPTRYRAIRAARRADQVSTLEATVQALAMLEGPGFDGAPLLEAFGLFVDGIVARERR